MSQVWLLDFWSEQLERWNYSLKWGKTRNGTFWREVERPLRGDFKRAILDIAKEGSKESGVLDMPGELNVSGKRG